MFNAKRNHSYFLKEFKRKCSLEPMLYFIGEALVGGDNIFGCIKVPQRFIDEKWFVNILEDSERDCLNWWVGHKGYEETLKVRMSKQEPLETKNDCSSIIYTNLIKRYERRTYKKEY